MRHVRFHADIDAVDRRTRVTHAFVDGAVASSATLHSILVALYRRMPEALAHAQRVGLLAAQMAEELGLDERTVDDVERAGWLHDLGKMVMPDHRPEGAERSDETDALQWSEQVIVATDIIRKAPFLRPAADLVLASRECLDGTGYPYRLSGDAIPLGARILHVADTFDALSAVCLSLGVETSAVHVELVRHAGSRFDPDVVAACLRCARPPVPGAAGTVAVAARG